jgi:hypothetical protein
MTPPAWTIVVATIVITITFLWIRKDCPIALVTLCDIHGMMFDDAKNPNLCHMQLVTLTHYS